MSLGPMSDHAGASGKPRMVRTGKAGRPEASATAPESTGLVLPGDEPRKAVARNVRTASRGMARRLTCDPSSLRSRRPTAGGSQRC